MKSIRLLSLLLSVLALTACGNLLTSMQQSGFVGMRDAEKDYDAAVKARDAAALKKICDDASLGDPNDDKVSGMASSSDRNRILNNRRVRGRACDAHAAMIADQDTGDCATVLDRFGKAQRLSSVPADEHYSKWGERLAKCNEWPTIFEKVVHVGNYGADATGVRVLMKLHKDGLKVADAFAKYMKDSAGRKFLPIEHAGFAANHIANWLIKTEQFDKCDALAHAITDAKEAVRANMLFYFGEGKCNKVGRDLCVGLLTSDSANFRQLACNNLRDVGDMSVLPKLRILIETDPANEIQESRGGDGRVWATKVYYVRDACKTAAGKIELRGK